MTIDAPFTALVILVLLAAFAILYAGIRLGMFIGRLRSEKGFTGRIEAERLDAVKRSRAVLGGQFSEQLSPYFPGFPADPTEARFIGKPVDFIAFAGASTGTVDEVLFIEVKSGNAQLTGVERSLRNAIEKGKVRFVEYRVGGSQK
jgi:predicted Holliday junction resolvase-like endonuclease